MPNYQKNFIRGMVRFTFARRWILSFRIGSIAIRYASALVVGGVFLIPGGIFGYLYDKEVWETNKNGLTNFELTPAIHKAVERRLNSANPNQIRPDAKLEIVILGFGIKESHNLNLHCLVMTADIIIHHGSSKQKYNRFFIAENDGNNNAPPAQCASLEHFSRNEAELITGTLTEYSDILAMISIKNLLKEGIQ